MAAVDERRHPALLEREEAGLILVDVQEAFRPVIDRFEEVIANCGLLAEGFGVLGRPVLVSEQYPKGLGHTVPELPSACPRARAWSRRCGSRPAGSVPSRMRSPRPARTWVVAGIETHVCVNQTVHDLLERGFGVQVAADAVSRTGRNRDLGLAKMTAAGAGTTSAEMALFEMLERAGSDEFKQISRLSDDATAAPGRCWRTASSSRPPPVAASGTALGEMVFTTGMTGYQEAVTDPRTSARSSASPRP